MAVTKDQLVVEVKVNNDGFEQKFQKSVATLSAFSATADQSTKKVEEFEGVLSDVKGVIDSVTINKMASEFAKLTEINSQLIRNMTQTQLTMSATSEAFSSSSNNTRSVANDLAQISKVSQQAASGITAMTQPLRQISDSGVGESLQAVATSSESLSTVKGFSNLSSSVEGLSRNLEQASINSEALNQQFQQQSTFASSLSNVLTGLFTAMQSFIVLSASIITIFEALSNPETLGRISHLADQLAMVADIKGFDKTADAVRSIGDALSYAATKSIEFQTRFQENVEKINFLIAAQDRATSMAATSAGVLGTALAGIGIHKVGQNFEKYKTTVNPIIGMMTNFAGASSKFGKVFGALSHPMLRVVEILFMLSPALAAFSDKMLDSENSIFKLIGTVSLFAAILGGTLGYALSFIISKISDFSIAIGVSMLASLAEAEHKFEKLQEVMSQFRYTLDGLARELGRDVVGSFTKWHGILDQLRQTTVFATTDIAKAIKYLVSEGVRFGLSQREITQEIVRVADVASAYGENIVDVAQKFNAAMAGNAQSLQNMGFAVGMSSLAHSKLYQEMGKTTDSLTDQELASIRMDLILKETSATIGAAANQAKTLAGSNLVLQKSQDDMAAAMGSSNTVIIQLNAAYAHLIRSVAYVGEPLFEVIGALKQYVGVTLIVVGTLFKHMIMITTLAKAYEILSVSASSSSIVIKGLTTAFSFLGSQLGFTAVAVTNLSSVLNNLSRLTMALALKSMTSLASMAKTIAIGFLAASRAVITFTLSLLANPIFLAGVAIAVSIAAIGKAIYDLSQEIFFIKKALDGLFGSFSMSFGTIAKDGSNVFVKLFEAVTKPIKAAFTFFANIIKLSLGGLTAIILLAEKARLSLKEMKLSAFSMVGGSSKESTGKYAKQLEDIRKQQDAVNTALGDTVYAIEKTSDELGNSIIPQALAAKGMSELSIKKKEESSALERFVTNQMKSFDVSIERASALGDEYDQLNGKIKLAQLEVTKAYKSNKDFDEKAKSIAEAKINLIKQEIEVEKKRDDVIKSMIQQRKSAQIDELKRSGQNTKAINLEFKDRIEQLREESRGLEKIGKLRLEDDIIINATIRALKAGQSTELDENKVKNLEKIQSIQEKIREIQRDNSDNSASEIQAIIIKQQEREKELATMRRQFKVKNEIASEAIKLIDAGQEAARDSAKLAILKLQKNTYDEIKKSNNELQSKINESNLTEYKFQQEKLRRELELIDLKEKELEIAGKLSKMGPPSKQEQDIRDELNKSRGLAKQEANTGGSEDYKQAKDVGDQIGKSMTSFFQEGVMGQISGAIAGAQGAIDAAQSLVDAIPKLLTSFGNLLDSITDLPNKIASGIEKVFKSVLSLVANFIPNIIKMVMGVIESLVSFIENLPEAFIKLFSNVDGLVRRLAEKLPMMAQRLVQGIVEGAPEIVAALAEFLIIKAPEIAWKLSYALSVSLPGALWHGIQEGMKQFGRIWQNWMKGNFSTGLTVKVDTEKVKKQFAQLTQDTSKLFSVKSLENAAKNAENEVKKIEEASKKAGGDIWKYFVRGMLDGAKWLGDAGTKIWNGLKTAAAYIGEFGKAMWDGLVTAVGDIAKTFGEWGTKIWEGLKKGAKFIGEFGKAMWDGLVTAIGDAAKTFGEWGTKIWNGFKKAAEFIGDFGKAMWDGLVTAVGDVAKTFGDWGTKIWDGLKAGAEFIGDFGKAMWDGLVTAIGDVAKTFGDWGTKIWNGFKNTIGSAFEDFGGSISTGFTAALPAIGKAINALFTGLGKAFENLFKLDFKGLKTAISDAFTSGSTAVTDAFKAVFNPMIDVINGIIEALNGIKIPAITYGGSILGKNFGGTLIPETDLIPGTLGKVAKMAAGGPVIGPGGTDMVPAMLTAGEFVMNRQSVSAIGLPVLNAMNQGKTGVGSSVQNITLHLTIESKERIDENFVRQRIMPTLRDELKRGSLDGRTVVYAGGVRK